MLLSLKLLGTTSVEGDGKKKRRMAVSVAKGMRLSII